MKSSNKTSPARQLLAHVWEYAQHDPWQRINYAMHHALDLAIRSGMKFVESDFAYFAEKFRWGYWAGSDREWIYTAAVLDGNASCVEAWEKHRKREPFRANDIRATNHRGFIHANHIARQRERLAVGFSFPYEGRRWFVTAFDDENGIVRGACYEHDHQTGAPKKIKGFTHEDIKALFPAPKKIKKQKEAA